MNRFKTIFRFPTLFLLLALTAFAGDLRNEGGKRYEVRVHEGATTRNTWIDGNSTTLGICSSCEIEVVGVGRLKIGGQERAVIKNGRLAKQ